MRAIVYCRTSTLDQAREEKVSIPDQINWAKTFALEKGWELVAEYIEPGVTGDTEPEQRNALNKLLEDANKDLFDIVLIYHSSRLAREPDIGMRVCRLLGQQRKQVYFRNAPIDPLPVDKFSWGINIGSQYMTAFSFIGDFQENVARSERVRSGFQGLAKKGKLIFAPYGYEKVPKITKDLDGRQIYSWTFILDPIKTKIVKRIFKDYAYNGFSLRQLVLILNREKIESPADKLWTPATIKNILTNPTYIGYVRWGRKLGGKYLQGKSSSGKQRRVLTPKDEWILTKGDHPKIIDEVTFNKVQDKLKIRSKLKGRAVASKGLLTGLVVCGRCGKKAYYKTRKIKKGSGIRSDYICSSYYINNSCVRHLMASQKLHLLVLGNIQRIISQKNVKEKLLFQNDFKSKKEREEEIRLLNNLKEQTIDKQERIIKAYEAGNLSLEEFGSAKKRLDEELIGTQNRISSLENKKAMEDQENIAKAKFQELLDDFAEAIARDNIDNQKNLIQGLISSVIIQNSKIKINYRLG